MVFCTWERHFSNVGPSVHELERKYDRSIRERVPQELELEKISMQVKEIENVLQESIDVNCNNFYDLYHLKDIRIESLRNKLDRVVEKKCPAIWLIDSHERLYHFLRLYQNQHLKNRKNVPLAVTSYLSLCEMIGISDRYRGDIFIFALNVLFEAKVEDRSVCQKLFQIVEKRNILEELVHVFDSDRLEYFLRHICDKNGRNEHILKELDVITMINEGHYDHVRVVFKYQNCINFTSEDVDLLLEFLFPIMPSRDAELFPKEYSTQRLYLLLYMAYLLQPSDISSENREKLLETFKLCWKIIPQAYISLEEMENVLGRLFNCVRSSMSESERQETEAKLRGACYAYLEIFRVSVKEPRSLMNYARIAARKFCKTAEALEEFNYPPFLKAYINLN